MNKLAYWAAAILAAALLGLPAEAAGPNAPSFELRSLDGKQYASQTLIGRPTLLMFWASWCQVCQRELPKVRALQEKMKGKPLQVVTIGFADTESNIRGYVTSHTAIFTFPVLYDTGDQVATRFGVHSTPTLFLLNKKGEIEIAHRGGGLLENEEFQSVLNRLLG